MAKPTRSFSADVNQFSTGAAGPDQIEHDLDNLFAMFDPGAALKDGSPGGIGGDNVKDGSLSDGKLADITIDQTQTATNTGKIGRLLSGIANAIKNLKGTSDWKDAAATSLAYLLANKSDLGHSHGNPPDGHTHDAFKAIDMLGVYSRPITNMTVARDGSNRISQMEFTVTGEETGSIMFHRSAAGKLDCTRLSNSLGTQIQVELVRDAAGKVTSLYRSGFNATLQSGLTWPIY